MTPEYFEEANTVFRPPNDLDESQCSSIVSFRGTVNNGGCVDGAPIVVVRWAPSPEEIEAIVSGSGVYLSCLGNTIPPHFLTVSFLDAVNPK